MAKSRKKPSKFIKAIGKTETHPLATCVFDNLKKDQFMAREGIEAAAKAAGFK
jgi:tRNA A37 threonylcarbamoyladenosine dehydratase